MKPNISHVNYLCSTTVLDIQLIFFPFLVRFDNFLIVLEMKQSQHEENNHDQTFSSL